MSISSFDLHAPSVTGARFDEAKGTEYAQLYNAGARGGIVTAIMAISDDTVDRTLELAFMTPADNILLGHVVVPAGAGHGTVPAVDVLAAIAPPAVGFVLLQYTCVLSAGLVVGAATNKSVDVVCYAGDF